MGTTYSTTTNKHIDKQLIENELTKINNIFSNWIPNSEIEKINNLGANQEIKISDDLSFLLQKSYDIYHKTNGFFDVSIGNLIDIWGFGTRKIKNKPNANQINLALKNSGFDKLRFFNNDLVKLQDIKLNFSAIAKGYAVDKIAELLQQQSITDFVVEIGGEVRVSSTKNIGIERMNKPPFKVVLDNEAIATSGDYRNYQIFNDKKFIHILNPQTGYPATSNLISVSVIAKDCTTADAFATALLAMGKDKAEQLINKYQLKSVVIDNKNNIYEYNLAK
jgi:thiamine biosynthesis lipoprotein